MENETMREARRRERNIERIQRFRLLDDTFMKVVLKDNIPGVQDIVRILLRRDDLDVVEVKTQEELTNFYGRDVRLDVLAKDADGKLYNIEIQRDSGGAGEKRARYHMGIIDTLNFPKNTDFGELPETYVIFITEEDIFDRGLPLYRIERINLETGELFKDGGHILYANAAYEGDDPIGMLMADFRATDPKDMVHESLAERARYYKGMEEGGAHSMDRIMEEVWTEGVEEGVEIGMKKGRAEGVEIGVRKGRAEMINALLIGTAEEELLHSSQFRALGITRQEIDDAKRQAI